MGISKIVLLMGMIFSLLWLMLRLFRWGNIKKILLTSVISGVLALIAVCVVGHFTTDTLEINPFTLGTASVLGIPGVILMMAVKIIWGL